MTNDEEPINVSYTNWRGKTSVRRIIPGELRFGVSEYHPEPTWLLNAFDLDHPAQIWKEFDLAKCDFVRDFPPARIEALERQIAAADKLAVIAQFVHDKCAHPTESVTILDQEKLDVGLREYRASKGGDA